MIYPKSFLFLFNSVYGGGAGGLGWNGVRKKDPQPAASEWPGQVESVSCQQGAELCADQTAGFGQPPQDREFLASLVLLARNEVH